MKRKRHFNLFHHVLAGLVLIATGVSGATKREFMSLDPYYGSLGLFTGLGWFDPDATRKVHIGSLGSNIYGDLAFGIYDIIVATASWGGLFPPDHARYEDDVVPLLDQSGGTRSASSSLQILNYSYAIGARTPGFCLSPGARDNCWAMHANLQYGHSVLSGNRFISKCSGCRTEDFGFGSGTFWQPSISIGLPSREKMGLELTTTYRFYEDPSKLLGEVRFGFELLML